MSKTEDQEEDKISLVSSLIKTLLWSFFLYGTAMGGYWLISGHLTIRTFFGIYLIIASVLTVFTLIIVSFENGSSKEDDEDEKDQ